MFRQVVLHGGLAEKYGEVFEFDLETPRQAINALFANFKGFREDFIKGFYHIVIGEKNTGVDLAFEELNFRLGNQKQVHIIPVIEGAKSQRSASTMKIVAGIMMLIPFGQAAGAALMAGATASAAVTAGAAAFGGVTLAKFGLAMVLTGTANLLAPSPKVNDYGSREQADQRPSFLFNGPVNVSASGQAIPLVYGRFRAGTILISSGMEAEQI